MSGSAFAVTHHAFSSGAGRTSDGNGSHASTLKSPSYTKSVSWQHYPGSLPLTTAATELSAIHGHSTSQYRLGEFYLHGSDGKPLDYTQARYWYEQSAEQENPRAQSKLGWIYLKGLGVKPDTRKAILWYKEAAEQGYAHAQYTLGLIYRNGTGINVNHYESQKWLKLAAKQHYKNAERLLAGLPAH